jgi:putative ABC transport system substrate-binding protein
MIARRAFIALLGAAATPSIWPLGARAQQPGLPVIGFLHLASSDAIADRLRAFHRGLEEVGLVEGDNVTIVYRWAEGRPERLPELAAELVQRRVAVIVAPASNDVAAAALAATRTIPILFAVSEDPVKLGFVSSLARPSGNATGVNFLNAELYPKRLEFLRELVPGVKHIALLVNPNLARTTSTIQEVGAAATAMGLQIQVVNASTNAEIDAAFVKFEHERPDALFVDGNPVFNSRRLQLSMLSARYALPASYSSRAYTEYGGLMSYGTDLSEAFRQLGVYAGRILRGAKPADLPVVQSSKFEMVINAQTARMLGLQIPQSLLATADEVIE